MSFRIDQLCQLNQLSVAVEKNKFSQTIYTSNVKYQLIYRYRISFIRLQDHPIHIYHAIKALL